MAKVIETKYLEKLSEVAELNKRVNELEKQNQKLKINLQNSIYKMDGDENAMCYDDIIRTNSQLKCKLKECEKEKTDLLIDIKNLSKANKELNTKIEEKNRIIVMYDLEKKEKESYRVNEEEYERSIDDIKKLDQEKCCLILEIKNLKANCSNLEISQQIYIENIEKLKNEEENRKSKPENCEFDKNINKNIEMLYDEVENEKLKNKQLEKSIRNLNRTIEDQNEEIKQMKSKSNINTIHKYRSSLALNKSEIDLKKTENDNLSRELKVKESKINILCEKVQNLEDELKLSKKKNADLIDDINHETAKLEVSLMETSSLINLNQLLKAEIDNLKKENEDLEGESNAFQQKYMKMNNEFKEKISLLESRLEEKEEYLASVIQLNSRNLNELKDEVEYHKSKYGSLNVNLKKEKEEKTFIENTIILLEKKIAEIPIIQNQKQKLQCEKMLLQETIEQLKIDVETANKKWNIEKENNLLNSDMIDNLNIKHNSKIKDLKDDIEQLNDEIKLLIDENKALKVKLCSYEEELDEISSLNEKHLRMVEDNLCVMESLKNEIKTYQSSEINYKQELFSYENELEKYKSIINGKDDLLNKSNKKYNSEIERLEALIKKLKENLKKTEQENTQLNRLTKTQGKIKKEMEYQMDLLRANENQIREINEENIRRVREYRLLNLELEDQVHQLESKIRKLEYN